MRKRSLFILVLFPVLASALLTGGAEPPETVSLPIVMYHHISTDRSRLGKYVISPDELEEDLRYLKSNGYTAVSAKQLSAWLRGRGSLPEKPVMITFDDAYESTAVYACPLLKKYQMRGIVAVIGSVADQYTAQPDHCLAYAHMNWETVSAVEAEGILEAACHTDAMHLLQPRKGCGQMPGESPAAYREALTADLTRFQEKLQKHTGHSAKVLAFPFGLYGRETLKTAEALGFEMVFSCSEKINILSPCGAALRLPVLGRFNRPSGISSKAFFARWNRE